MACRAEIHWSPFVSPPIRSARRTYSSSIGASATRRKRRSRSGSSRRAGWPGGQKPSGATGAESGGRGLVQGRPVAGTESGRVQERAAAHGRGWHRSRPRTTFSSARPIASRSAHREWSRSFRTGSRSVRNRRSCCRCCQRPLRTISGRVVDRQGKPVRGHRGFPGGRRAGTDGDQDRRGRPIRAGRLSPGAGVSLRARRGVSVPRTIGQARRWGHHSRVDTHESSGRRARCGCFRDPIPLEESRALARRLLEPYWAAFEKKNDAEKHCASAVAARRPTPSAFCRSWKRGVCKRSSAKSRLQASGGALAGSDRPGRAEAVAESIEEPGMRFRPCWPSPMPCPRRERDRKLALLDRAVLEARALADPTSRA